MIPIDTRLSFDSETIQGIIARASEGEELSVFAHSVGGKLDSLKEVLSLLISLLRDYYTGKEHFT